MVRLEGAALAMGGVLHHGLSVLVEGGRIRAILPDGEPADAVSRVLPRGTVLGPGLLDLQVNGGGGVLINDQPSAAGLRAVAAAHAGLGTAAILPTVITGEPETMERAAAAAIELAAEPGARVLGIHFEGPFLSHGRPGIHPKRSIRPPDDRTVALLCETAARIPVLLTVAPERVGGDVLDRLLSAGIVVSAGHTDATAAEAEAAFAHGVRAATHLFNAMPPLAARAPGVAAAALLAGDVTVGLIADGIHVDQAMLRLARACKGVDRTLLVSDAMPCAGTMLAVFELAGRTIHRAEGCLRAADGTLAGADLHLAEAVRRAASLMRVPLAEAIAMASEVPARLMRLGDRGRLAVGCRAEFVVVPPEAAAAATLLSM